jgi:transposase
MGARSAGNPHAACDVEGTGDVAWSKGLPARQSSTLHLKAAYEKAIGHATSDSTVYNLLHRHGWRKLMPRPHHPKRDLAAQNAFKKTAFLML